LVIRSCPKKRLLSFSKTVEIIHILGEKIKENEFINYNGILDRDEKFDVTAWITLEKLAIFMFSELNDKVFADLAVNLTMKIGAKDMDYERNRTEQLMIFE
jgi:hypothetical protein